MGKGPWSWFRVFFWFALPGVGIRDSPRGASVAPVRGGTYFSLSCQRKVGKRKALRVLSGNPAQ